ncbi:pyridoxal phosphate-dependent aminotransferase [Ramlibacter sp. Leaf400]|uniref:pyridoxal phosphate-dependent aminotransferase n=1 Tax=Ramlibacter sp. Leaf400 TaxID=1736365 RepID=UPI0006FA6964|nr:pyridoxal phosphate-dependent aminotransferase [Ramlibacter sp. Leaf400]KQT14031.1 aspartate aminotransferase [Ramlibacter sp. Leaf400]
MAGQRVRELRAAGRDVLGLTAGEPDFDTPLHIRQAAQRAMEAGKTKYTDVGGTPELKAAIRDKFARENGLHYETSEIIACTGAKQAIFNALMCTVEHGAEVIIPAPCWVSYPDIVRLAGGSPVLVPCDAASGFKLTPDQLERAITPRTRWLLLNSPNNPSGAVITRDEMRALADVLLRHPHVCILADDIYEHLVYDDREFVTPAQVEPRLRDRTLTVNGVSKAYAMTGWRIGYAAGPAALIKNMVKLQSQSTSNPSSISQAAAVAALNGPQDFIPETRAVFQRRRDLVVELLNQAPGVRCHRPEGAFYLFASCEGAIGKKSPRGSTIATDMDFTLHLLDAANIAVIQGDAYGLSPFFRISFADSEERLREGCRRIRLACEELA